MTLPPQLPRRLTITLWDFSWYTMSLPGEAFDDLDRCFREAAVRGYNTIRICAMPLLLFGPGPRPGPLAWGTLAPVGIRTRWYNVRGGAVFDGHDRLLQLFDAAQRHGFWVILSSWEYQQTTTFLATDDLQKVLRAVAPADRFLALARAWDRLLDFLKAHGLGDRVAYVELHNEAEYGQLVEVAHQGGAKALPEVLAVLKPFLEAGIAHLRARHPDVLVTACFGLIEAYPKALVPGNEQVAHFHLYVRGVLQEAMDALDLEGTSPFPGAVARALLRADAPSFDDYVRASGPAWRWEGNPVGLRLLYVHDWCDPALWDRALTERWDAHREAMVHKVDERLGDAAAWARSQDIPVVIGEGHLGYTPLYAQFEEGPLGKQIAERAVQRAIDLGFWGTVLGSNAAPHHPFWHDVEWQRLWNHRFLNGAP